MGICGSKQQSSSSAAAAEKQKQKQKQSGAAAKTRASSRENLDAVLKSEAKGNEAKGNDGKGNDGKGNDGKNSEIKNSEALLKSPDNSANDIDANEEMKVLLLGAGESGKSTILQQLKIIHQNGYTDKELYEYIPLIYSNLFEIGRDLINARNRFGIPHDNGLSAAEIDEFVNYNFNLDSKLQATDGNLANLQEFAFPYSFSQTLSKLWTAASTQDLISGPNSSLFYLMDSAPYFLEKENLNRITSQGYKPSLQDVLRSRQKTSGIFDTHINMDSNLKLHFFDVGGQRSERKKWIHCFDNVAVVIFCVSLSEYDQFLVEDTAQNRFQESLVLFDNIVNSRWFARTSVVLFLNKIDLFAEKLNKKPLETYFPDYTGGNDINKATKYILWRFIQLNRANLNIYPHVTQATDTSNVKLVFAAIKETILENSLKDTGMLQ